MHGNGQVQDGVGAASAAAPQSDAQSPLTFSGNVDLGHLEREDETGPPLVYCRSVPLAVMVDYPARTMAVAPGKSEFLVDTKIALTW